MAVLENLYLSKPPHNLYLMSLYSRYHLEITDTFLGLQEVARGTELFFHYFRMFLYQ